jgi:hypothetical protein
MLPRALVDSPGRQVVTGKNGSVIAYEEIVPDDLQQIRCSIYHPSGSDE